MQPMIRVALCLLFLIAFALVQGVAPHAHLESASNDHLADHHAITEQAPNFHIHTHVINDHIDASHEYSDVTQIDLLKSTLSSHNLHPLSMPAALVGLFIVMLAVLWFCIERLPPFIRLVHFGPPRLRSSSSRAPPR